MPDRLSPVELLRWYVEMGADEAIAEAPVDRFAMLPSAPAIIPPRPAPKPALIEPPPPRPVAPAPVPMPAVAASPAVQSAAAIANAAQTLAELEAALRAFDGCALKKTATNTVFADGVPGAPLLVIGEAPGADEDRIGLPFVGRSGQLLDRMLATIGYDRKVNAYISNMLFWRPPGNRKPTPEEIASCLPFVWRLIALAKPKVVLLSGGTATAAMLERTEGITRLRGRWFDLPVAGLDRPMPTLATYHPSFLLRTPARKNEAWRDLLAIQRRLEVTE